MIKRQISFLFEDPGFCIDVFCTIAEPVRYYNRDTESGAWYSSTPDWNENGSLIREDLIFEVIADGVVCALDGNGNFEGKKPFVPFCQFRQSLVQYSIWFDHPKIHDAVERAKPRLHGLRCIQEQKEGKLLLQDGALLFKPKYAKKYARTMSQSQILSLSWELGVEDEEPDTDAAPVTLPYKKFGATHPIQLQVTSYLNGNLAIQMVTWESGDPEPWATLTVNLPGQRQKDHAFIDTNADSEFPTWLIRHGLAIPTGRTMQSGFCTYPEYRFRANRLQELDPEGYAGYLKNFERRCSA